MLLNKHLKKEKTLFVHDPIITIFYNISHRCNIVIHGFQLLEEKPYDLHGNMIKELITKQQKDVSSIVGYFKFRRQTEVTLSVRDQLWMNSYASKIPHGCIAIISSNLNVDKTTHTYEFAFWDMKNKEQ